MVSSFGTALGTALTTFVADVTSAVGSNTALAIGFSLGVVGIFVIWRVVMRLVHAR